jgi:hypothetical protein
MFDDKYMFTDGQFTLVLWEMDFGSLIELTDSIKKIKQNNQFSITQFSLEWKLLVQFSNWLSPNVIWYQSILIVRINLRNQDPSENLPTLIKTPNFI